MDRRKGGAKTEMERKYFGEAVQTATVVGAAYGIHRTTLTQAAKAGGLGRSAYRSGDAWLIKTDHEDFWEWGHDIFSSHFSR